MSYGTGAQTLIEQGEEVVDLELPDDPDLFDLEFKVPALFENFPATLVVAHEEFDVTVVARELGVPCCFLTDWSIF